APATGILRRFGSLAGMRLASTVTKGPARVALRRSCRHHAQAVDQPVGAPAERIEVERLGRRAVRRSPEQVALPRPDPERTDELELGRRLDPLGDDQRAPAVGEVAQRPDDLERRLVDGAALDQRQVDLDDVELELAEEAKPGVAGADVVGGEADAGDAAVLSRATKSGDVLYSLAFGQLEDDVPRIQAVA